MTLVKHELRQGRLAFVIWTSAIAFMMAVSIFIFPEMKGEMDSFDEIMASMGSFTDAFGMDKLNFGTFVGYYAIECGNVIGLGGAFFAALCGAGALSKEERNRTAEFLLTHPVTRTRIVTEKLIALLCQVLLISVILFGVCIGVTTIIGESIPWKEMLLLHFAYLLLQIELVCICFGISAFMRKGSVGAGLGTALMMYFLNLIANMAEPVKWLKYITPFGYTDGAEIVTDGRLDLGMVLIGMGFATLGVVGAYKQFCGKDIQ